MIVYENSLHFEVCLLTGLLILKLNEGILKTIACALVPDDFTGHNFPKATKNQV